MGESIALGFGNTIDYEIELDPQIVENLITQYHINASEIDRDIPIFCIRDLLISILGFLICGSGGERFVNSHQIIQDFASLFRNKITIGGSSVRAANAMRKLGNTSALHLVSVNDHIRKLLPADCPWVCSNDQDSFYPHLIVQYTRDTQINAGDIIIRTNRANRIIYVNDQDNTLMKLNPDFSSLISDARLFFISGFNAMQNSDLLAERLQQVKKITAYLPTEALIYYEDACFHQPELSLQVRQELIDLIDFYGLNEDELQGYIGREIDLLNAEETYNAIKELSLLIAVPRLIVHTQHWALSFGSASRTYGRALQNGITMATTRYRFGDDFQRIDYINTGQLPVQETAAEFAHVINQIGKENIYCIPVSEVAEEKPTTIGLGDAFVGGFLPSLLDR